MTCKGSSIWKTHESLRGIVPSESTSALSAIKSTLGQPKGVRWGTLSNVESALIDAETTIGSLVIKATAVSEGTLPQALQGRPKDMQDMQ